MNTYPTTAEQIYMEQKMRDDNNPYNYERKKKLSKVQEEKRQKEEEELSKKYKEGQIAGYDSKRYDFPEYKWWMIQDGKKYYRRSCNLNVYDYEQCSVIVGTWNREEQRIEFIGDHTKKIESLLKRVEFLEQQLLVK